MAITFAGMNRLKGIIYEIIGWLAILGPRKTVSVKKLLIIRVDEIGDYMLWRPLLNELVQSEAVKDFVPHFCGNQSWKSIYNCFDERFISKTFWLDKTRFKKNMWYRYLFLRAIYREGYAVVINPTFSRDKRYDDSIVRAAQSPENLGMVSNSECVQPFEKGYDKKLYTRLFDHPQKPLFEFYRNKYFAEYLTGKPVNVFNTRINQSLLTPAILHLPEKYFVVFPGSRSRARIWPAENFVRVSNFIFENYGLTAVVCGAASDAGYTHAFCSQYTYPLLDLTGKTSLTDMLSLFTKAACLLSVDTGSVHLAAAAGCTVFGIFNGSQYQRFAPYPAALQQQLYAIYPDEVEPELDNEALVKEKYEFVVPIPYAWVKAEKMILAVHHHFTATGPIAEI